MTMVYRSFDRAGRRTGMNLFRAARLTRRKSGEATISPLSTITT